MPPSLLTPILPSSSSPMFSSDSDPPHSRLPRLGHHHTQNPILQPRADAVDIDPGREGEGARELADGPFPPLPVRRLLLLASSSNTRARSNLLGAGAGAGAGRLGGLGAGRRRGRGRGRGVVLVVRVVLDGGLVRAAAGARLALGLLRLGFLLLPLLLRSRRVGIAVGGSSVVALDAAPNDEGLGLGELNVDVLALEAGELAVQLVGGLGLADVEARGEGRRDGRPPPGLSTGLTPRGGHGCLGLAVVVAVDALEEAKERAHRAEREFGRGSAERAGVE
ncbi:hypothetical protein VTK26DRAFT_4956 [Humicola hyalothermophila]